MVIRIFEGSGKESGIEVKLSKVVEDLLQVWQFKVDLSCPKKRKRMNDQSLLKVLDQFSRARSLTSLLSESGFSIKGFSYLKLSSS
jgi:hypothetical protein